MLLCKSSELGTVLGVLDSVPLSLSHGIGSPGREMRELWIQGARLIRWVRLASAPESGHCR
jgi:hypothetical protein